MAPILGLAIHGDLIACADGDGLVQTWRVSGKKLATVAKLHEDPKKPIGALAATPTGFVGVGASLYSWSLAGNTLARAALPAVGTNVVVRGETVYVLAGGKLLAFLLPKLKPEGEWEHAGGTPCELDVSDDGKRALVVRDRKLIEIIDLKKNKSVGDWTRKGKNIDIVSARFGAGNVVMCVCDDDYRLTRVKDTTGRVSGEYVWLESRAGGPIVLDAARRFAAIGLYGENVELIELVDKSARGVFLLDPRITDATEKSLASLKRIPTFKAIAPGFFARHGSVAAPSRPSTLSAIAVSDGGGLLAAGYVVGDLVVADTATGAVVSSQRGMLSEGRERMRIAVTDIAGSVLDGNDLWILQKDLRFVIVDLEKHTRREGPRLELEFEGELSDAIGGLDLKEDTIVSIDRKRVLQWSRKDGSLIGNRELPENKGLYVEGKRILLLPISSLGHEGFDIVSLDLATGATTVVTHFHRDEKRFALGNQPHGWVAFGCTGTTPTITIWAGMGLTIAKVFTFDLTTGQLGNEIPWAADADGEFLATPDFSNPLQPGDAVKVTKVATDEEILRCPYEPGDAPRTSGACFDSESKYVAGRVGDPQIGVWRPGARRLILDGHRDPRSLFIRARSLVATDRFWMRVWDVSGA